mgnify:CR=1 FL=1
METQTHPNAATLAHWEKNFPPLSQEQRTHVDTNAAAHYLNRRPQTLRGWHCHGVFPTEALRPLVINGRLAFSVAAIKAIMGVAQS